MLAHRISWLIAHGTLPSTLICHHCDNPPCVRPEHLFNGTHSDNAADRESKGRGHQVAKKGEAHYKARLTEDAVRSIRALHRQGERMIDIARKFECDPTNIRHIITGKNWKSVL
jgi:hypothetical protein